MSHEISDVEAMKRLRLAIGAMVLGAVCLVGVVGIVTAVL